MINWNRRAYSKEQFIDSWNSSLSIAQCARKLNLVIYGSTYKTLRATAKDLGLTESHMNGQGWNKGSTYKNYIKQKPLEELLIKGSKIGSNQLKKRLLKEGLLENICSKCGQLPLWCEEMLILHLDHIDGDNENNLLENLRMLCLHCHSQTPTYCRRKSNGQTKEIVHRCIVCQKGCRFVDYWHRNCNACIDCGMKSYGLRCQSCNGKTAARRNDNAGFIKFKIVWPSNEELLDMLAKSNYTKVGKQLGVSDNAIRKHLNR